MNEFVETLNAGWTQRFDVERVLFEHRTDHQHLVIFESTTFGRVMALDGIVQTTERDEFIYHETLTHVPMFSHPDPKRVLIVGGGDGAMLREVLRHQSVERVTQVEIDQAVIDMCVEHLPNHSAGAYDNPRANIVIDDGANFVREARANGTHFDVIISDSTDPIGPGEALFESTFYADCHGCLAAGGVMGTQNGNAFGQVEELQTTARRMGSTFADMTFFSAAIPTYIGGLMYFAWGTDDLSLRQVPEATLRQRFDAAGFTTRYYTPAVHKASFALPAFVEAAIRP